MQDGNNHMTGQNEFSKAILLDPITFANLSTLQSGQVGYCSDCKAARPCAGGGNGALFRVEGGTANCSSGSLGVQSGPPVGSCTDGLDVDSAALQTYVCIGGAWSLLSGVTPSLTVTPPSISFGNVALGPPSPPSTITLTAGALAVTSLSISTSDQTQFPIVSNTCGPTLSAGSNCSVSVAFDPNTATTITGAITISSNAAGSPVTVSLTGTGVAAPNITNTGITLTPTGPTVSVGSTLQLLATEQHSDLSTLNVTSAGVGYNAPAASSNITFVQGFGCGTATGTSLACAAKTNTAGNLLVVFPQDAALISMSASDTNGDAFTCANTNGNVDSVLCYAIVKTTGSNTISCSRTTSGILGCGWMEFNGVPNPVTVEPAGGVSLNGTGATSAISDTTSGANDVIVACSMQQGGSGTYSVAAGFTMAWTISGMPSGCAYDLNVAPGTTTATFTPPSGTNQTNTYAIAFVGANNTQNFTINSNGVLTAKSVGSGTASVNSGRIPSWSSSPVCSNTTGSITTLSCPFNGSNAKNNTLLAAVSWADATAVINTPTDTNGNTWTILSHVQLNGVSMYLYGVPAALAGANTVTVTWASGAKTPAIKLFEVAGAAGAFDTQNTASVNSTLCAVTATTTQAADLLIGVAFGGPAVSIALQTPVPAGAPVGPGGIGPFIDSDGGNAVIIDSFAAGSQTVNFANNTPPFSSVPMACGIVAVKTFIGSDSITIGSGTAQTFSWANQYPTGSNWYPNSLMNIQLPADVQSHYATNDQQMINCAFSGGNALTDCSTGANTGVSETNTATNGRATIWKPTPTSDNGSESESTFHYCDASCPVFMVKSIVRKPQSAALDPTGKFFHLPSAAQYSGVGSCDHGLVVWDQSTDQDPTQGGRMTASYACSSTLTTLPTCTCTTATCAQATASCQLSLSYFDYDYPFNDPTPFQKNAGGWSSLDLSPAEGILRQVEVTNATINHGLLWGIGCVSSTPVFPAVNTTLVCTDSGQFHPPIGSAIYIDNTYNCNTQAKPWALPVCLALQKYLNFVGDTGGPANGGGGGGFWVQRVEQGITYTASQSNAVTPFLATFTDNVGCSAPTGFKCAAGSGGTNGILVSNDGTSTGEVNYLDGMPGVITHLHILDPCVAKGIAGVAGGCN